MSECFLNGVFVGAVVMTFITLAIHSFIDRD
jgi:hypothetical protein